MQKLTQQSLWWVIGIFCIGMLMGCSTALEKAAETQNDAELFEAGKALYDQGTYKQALDYFLYVKEHFIRSAYAGAARFYAGNSYFAREDYEEAAIEYESFLLFFPEDPLAPEAQFKLGASYFEQSKGPERDQSMLHSALEAFQKVQTLYPDAPQTYIQQADEYLYKTRSELARHEYMIGLFYRKERDYKASNLRFAYLIMEYPESDVVGDALYNQGRNYLDLEQPEQAAASFSQFIQNYPEHPSAPDARLRLKNLGGSAIQNSSTITESTPPTSFSTSSPLNGSILTLRDSTVTTDLLRDDGLQEAMRLKVYRGETEIGIIRITAIYDGFSIGEIESLLPGMMVQEDDRVCCPVSAP